MEYSNGCISGRQGSLVGVSRFGGRGGGGEEGIVS